jgi:hypothetical protein
MRFAAATPARSLTGSPQTSTGGAHLVAEAADPAGSTPRQRNTLRLEDDPERYG